MLFSIVLITPGENNKFTANQTHQVYSSLIVILSIVSVALVFLQTSRPQAVSDNTQEVKIITYNIQQGYSDEV
jgi:hypothetical protein